MSTDIAKDPKRSVEVHWHLPGSSEMSIDTYPGNAEVERDMSGALTVRYSVTKEDGGMEEFTITYGYGEDRKVVEKVEYLV